MNIDAPQSTPNQQPAPLTHQPTGGFSHLYLMQWSFAHTVVAVIAGMWVLDGMRPQFQGSAYPGSMVDGSMIH